MNTLTLEGWCKAEGSEQACPIEQIHFRVDEGCRLFAGKKQKKSCWKRFNQKPLFPLICRPWSSLHPMIVAHSKIARSESIFETMTSEGSFT